MNPLRPRNPKRGPEDIIEEAITAFLRQREWFVRKLHGNMYQSGLPDLFCCHHRYGIRMVEVKNPLSYSFTPAQLEDFPKLVANGCPVWVLVAATEEEYAKLFKPCNWYLYLNVMR